MTSVQVPSTMATNDSWDSDGSLSWEDFFGASSSTDLVPTLLGMYDALVGRSSQAAAVELSAAAAAASKRNSMVQQRSAVTAPQPREVVSVSRPLSISSIASSSSSSSSGTSSCSGSGGRRLGAAPKSSAYLASIESLEDDSDDVSPQRQKTGSRADRLKCPGGSQGSADSGVCSPCSYISSPCPPQGRPRYCDPHLSYMDRVVMEIVETEGVYVRDLQQVIQGYLERWRGVPDCPLLEKQLGDLFNNIEDIYKFNSGFLQELEQCGLDPVQVARSFVRNNMGFSIYTQYCTNYPRTVSLLTELMRREATVRLFRERQSALQHTLPLGSYLLKPVQRILKYHLLLQNIVKHYVNEAEGYCDIVEALSAMTGIAHHINNMKRKHEHAVRVQEIQSLLYSWEGEDLTTFGELCAEGAFRMSGAKALRHAFLFDKMLLITKKKEEGILGYKTHIMCSNLMLIESVPGEPLSFHVIPFDNPRLQHTLQARNLEQKREWSLQLKRVILENYNAVIPSHARQLVMELGQNRTDDEIMADKNTPKRQHSAPEYLEKRKQEKERRKSETGLRYRLRRSRKSDAGETAVWHQRRRASSSSRDPSETRETERSTTIKERFGTWRRKSEPGCYSGECKLTVSHAGLETEPDTEPEPTPEPSLSLTEPMQEDQPTTTESVGGRTLEEIVGQLLMQNREFQKILKKQQRHVNTRRCEETTDDEDGVYETLGQSYRAHRQAHMRALRNEQRSITTARQPSPVRHCSPPPDPDYESLVCTSEASLQPDNFGNYDNLEHVWESVQRQQAEIQQLADAEEAERALRRTQSFSWQQDDQSALLCSISQVSLGSPALPCSPTLPAVWLKQQGAHLAAPQQKSGSLPRSFQLGQDLRQRPFTIASDKPQEINLEDMERYMEEEDLDRSRVRQRRFPTCGDTTEDESQTESTQELNIHPEYRIYRRGDCDGERRASRLVQVLVRHYGRTLRRRLRTSDEMAPTYKQGSSSLGARIAHCSDYANPRQLFPNVGSVLSISSNLTSSSEGDKTSGFGGSVDTKTLPLGEEEPHLSDGSADSFYERSFEATECFMEPDLRDSAVFSDHEDEPPRRKIPPPVPTKPDSSRTRTAIGEKLRELEEKTRYRRSEQRLESLGRSVRDRRHELEKCKVGVFHEDIGCRHSTRTSSRSVQDRRQELEKCRVGVSYKDDTGPQHSTQTPSRSVRDRRQELESCRTPISHEDDTSSQHSTASTVIEVSPVESEEGGSPRGWVQHVVGKLQGGPSTISNQLPSS